MTARPDPHPLTPAVGSSDETLRLLFSYPFAWPWWHRPNACPGPCPRSRDMLALDPASLATKTVGTNTTSEAVCITLATLSQIVPGSRVWRYLSGATDATNLISQGGPLARAPGASTGRWFTPRKSARSQTRWTGRSTNELAAFGAGGALGGVDSPVSEGALPHEPDWRCQGAINSLSSGKFGCPQTRLWASC